MKFLGINLPSNSKPLEIRPTDIKNAAADASSEENEDEKKRKGFTDIEFLKHDLAFNVGKNRVKIDQIMTKELEMEIQAAQRSKMAKTSLISSMHVPDARVKEPNVLSKLGQVIFKSRRSEDRKEEEKTEESS